MENIVQLEPNEARILGVLVEKELTVPDQYPLSLNATTSGCNQKSNRNPVMSMSEIEVQMQLDKLVVAGLVGRVHPANSRVERFRHNFREHYKLDSTKAAIMAELMMRGPQSRGDLRTRVNRMTPVESLDILAANLNPLIESGFVKRLPPLAGSRAERFTQCLAPDAHPAEEAASSATAQRPPVSAAGSGALEKLELRVATLERQLASLAEKLGEPLDCQPEESPQP
ncbi:MAG: hypothetical protein ACI8X5_001353 [Planctomycetota bacterium]|jgi:uncharacterized protein YceH (UPF0502 family)